MATRDEVVKLLDGLITSVNIHEIQPSLVKDLCVIAGEFHGEMAAAFMILFSSFFFKNGLFVES
jgi:hypothetical protein